jgi:sugar lactone lactonase YvrE
MSKRPGFLCAVIAVLALLIPGAAVASSWSVHVFAKMPAPGYPADAVLDDDGYVYAGSFHPLEGGSDAPSKVFAFAPNGAIARSYTVTGQAPGAAHGVQVALTDSRGRLYLLDQTPARVVILNPRTGAQSTYATIPTLPGGNAPEPDFAAWGPDGSMYITDYSQYVIWRIPPGGGTAKVWLSNPAFDGVIVGPAGIQLMADHHTLMFDQGGEVATGAEGVLYTVPIEPNGSPGALRELWASTPAQAPDGLAIARSGDIYIAMVGPAANQIVELSPTGKLLNQTPGDPLSSTPEPIPFDAPGSILFDGDQIIVGNQSSINENTANMALLEVGVGETGQPIYVPPGGPPPPRLKISVARRRVAVGRALKLRVTVSAAGRRVSGVSVAFDGATANSGPHGGATFAVRLPHAGRYPVAAMCPGYRPGAISILAARPAR